MRKINNYLNFIFYLIIIGDCSNPHDSININYNIFTIILLLNINYIYDIFLNISIIVKDLFKFYYFFKFVAFRASIVVSIPACHAGDRSSILRLGVFFIFRKKYMTLFFNYN